jgi:hypothetical protein
VGFGYQGGYWGGGHFNYNRQVNRIDVTVVHNVYTHPVTVYTNNRVSFNGGSGGLQVRPRPAELAALREPHAAPMRTQIAVQHAASTNRAQFASVNHGRPATLVGRGPAGSPGGRPARRCSRARRRGATRPRCPALCTTRGFPDSSCSPSDPAAAGCKASNTAGADGSPPANGASPASSAPAPGAPSAGNSAALCSQATGRPAAFCARAAGRSEPAHTASESQTGGKTPLGSTRSPGMVSESLRAR